MKGYTMLHKIQLSKADIITLLKINPRNYREDIQQHLHNAEYAFKPVDFPSISLYPRKGFIFLLQTDNEEELQAFIKYGYSSLFGFQYFPVPIAKTKTTRGSVRIRTDNLQNQLDTENQSLLEFQKSLTTNEITDDILGLPSPSSIFKKS